MKYEFVDDLTSDVMFRAYGKGMKEVFENAASALFSVICQTGKVRNKVKKEVEVRGEGPEDLMFNWLQELISIVDIDMLFFSKFEVTEISKNHIRAKCYGEEADPAKGETVVKGVTGYKYEFKKTEKGYEVTVSLDI